MAKTPSAAAIADWDAIEREYRLGTRSNRAIAKDYGISDTAIRKRAMADGWIKGEAHAVRARTIALANQAAVPRLIEPTPEALDELAQVGADVLIRHRTMAATMAGLVATMNEQLRFQTDVEPDLADRLTEYYEEKCANNPVMAGIYKQQLNSALHAIGLNTRSKTMTNLTTAVDKLISIERKAWNLDADTDNRSYEDLLAELHAKAAKAA